MRFKSIMLAGAMLLAPPAFAAEPTPAPAPAQGQTAPAIDLETARNAVGHTDFTRLTSDRAYAGQMLAYLDRLASAAAGDPEASPRPASMSTCFACSRWRRSSAATRSAPSSIA